MIEPFAALGDCKSSSIAWANGSLILVDQQFVLENCNLLLSIFSVRIADHNLQRRFSGRSPARPTATVARIPLHSSPSEVRRLFQSLSSEYGRHQLRILRSYWSIQYKGHPTTPLVFVRPGGKVKFKCKFTRSTAVSSEIYSLYNRTRLTAWLTCR